MPKTLVTTAPLSEPISTTPTTEINGESSSIITPSDATLTTA